ncbi:hypothetical protein BGZ65_000147 [Modicella reniformis]|uniref:Uncharacterized protein n=1 Tax=Modicella reniformis TaxID=1440133 RepID=A0A9P6LTK7_9FUNG|nr:hypothetical protein BGZ65_000147 [Modicella reniformis]
MTDEYRTSKTRIYCFNEVRQAKSHCWDGTNIKVVNLHDTVECDNPDCPSFKRATILEKTTAQQAPAQEAVEARQALGPCPHHYHKNIRRIDKIQAAVISPFPPMLRL